MSRRTTSETDVVAPEAGHRHRARHVRARQLVVLALVAAWLPLLGNAPAAHATASPDTWAGAASMNTVRYGAAAATGADGKIYAIGGANDVDGFLASVEQYDTGTNTWTTVAPMPGGGRVHLAAATGPDGRIYAIGGEDGGSHLTRVEAYDPGTDTWTTVASMNTAHSYVAAATGPDGRIYALGGWDNTSTPVSTVEAYDTGTNTWTTVASMPTARMGLAAATGSDGHIYAMGGNNGPILSTVEAYDTATNTWATAASMPTARTTLAATAGPDGRVYAMGGRLVPGPGRLSTVEAYTPGTNTWVGAAAMSTARSDVAAATGPDGRVYAIGGVSTSAVLDTTEAYTGIANTWAGRANMPTARFFLGAATGPDQKIYAVGGSDGSNYLDTVEGYDAASDAWQSRAAMPTARGVLGVTTGADGRIYAIGGFNGTTVLDTVEAYNPGTDTWFTGGTDATLQHLGTSRLGLGAATGSDGTIYAIGGAAVPAGKTGLVEARDPVTGNWTTKAPMPTARYGAATVTGPDGRIYVIGGFTDSSLSFSNPTNKVEVYDPSSNTWSTAASLPTSRGFLAASVGPDGRIYAIGGGANGSDYLDTVEAYDPMVDSWTTAASLATARNALAAATGPDGRVYAIGGTDGSGALGSVEAYSTGRTRTGTLLTSSPNPAGIGQTVTLTATVFPVAPAAGTPLGTVHFFEGATDLGGATLAGAPATASLPVSGLSGGTHLFHASYGGQAPFVKSTSATVSVEVRTPAHITSTAGSPQHTMVGTAFATPPEVLVTDSSSNPVPGQQVTFTAPGSGASGTFAGSGTVTETEPTFGDGKAHTTTFTANTTAGSYAVVATLSGLPPVTVALVNDPGSATTLSLSGYPSPITAGAPGSFTATALDTYGNIATAYGGTLTFSSSDPAASLPAPSSLTAGTKTFAATFRNVGTHHLDATDGTLSASQTGITVNPGAATHLVVSGYPSPTTAGASHIFTVAALDASNNVATGYAGTVHLTSSDGAAVLGANNTLVNGTRMFLTTLRTAGLQSITATDTLAVGVTGSQSVTVQPAAATHLVVTGFAYPTVAGAPHTFTVTAKDAYNNTATAYGGSVHFTSSDPAAALPPGDWDFAAGTRTFAATLNTTGTRSLSASDGTLPIASQTGIVVTPAAATHFVVSGFPNPTTAGASHTFTVTAKDGSNNTDTAYAGTVHITSSDGQAVLPADATLSNGMRTFYYANLKTAGTQYLTATDTLAPSITGSQTGIVVNPGATIHLVLAGYPTPTTAGDPHAFTVTAKDAYNNTITTYGGTIHVTSSDPAALLPADSTLIAGTKTFAATLKTAGTRSLTAGDGTLSASQTGIAVNPAAVHHLVVSGYPNPTTAGTHTLTVTAQDQFNNTTPTYAGTVHFTSSDPQAVLPADSTLTNGAKSFNAVLKTAGTQYLTATDTVAPSITGTQGPITLNPGALSNFVVSGYPSPTVAGASHSFTVRALDAYGNTVTGYGGMVHFTSTDLQAVLPADSTLTNGVKTFSATLESAGLRSITAADTVTPSKKGTQGSITVTTAAANHLVVSGYPSPTTAGTAHTFTVTAKDQFNNTATAYGGTVHFTSNDAQAVLPANSTLTNGTKSFSATLKTPGTRSITATDTLHATITGTQGSITVN